MFNEKFWLAIAFLTFAAFIIKFVGPLIARALDGKSKQIAEEILLAKELKEKAQKLLDEAEKYLTESISFAEKIVKDAEEEVKRFSAESRQSLEAEIKIKTNAAMQRIKIEEESAIREIKNRIVESAIEGLSASFGKDLDENSHNKIVEKAIADFEKAKS